MTLPLKSVPWTNVLLFIATLLTTFWAGITYGPPLPSPTVLDLLLKGAMYALPLLAILLCHEMGHYLTARRHGVKVSLPFFLPVPSFEGGLNVGTLGAIIRMRSKPPTPSALLEIGAAGPLAGMAVAVPLLIVGLWLSPVLPFPKGGIVEGDSILYLLLKRIVAGPIPEGYDVILHPIAWASWIGLFVTMINLFPVGQLDGGHIVFALFTPRQYRIISNTGHTLCLVLFLAIGWYYGTRAIEAGLPAEAVIAEYLAGLNWLVWALLLLVLRRIGRGHPPVGEGRLSRKHKILGFATLILFVLIFMPVPLHLTY